jgi:hypothetical protein
MRRGARQTRRRMDGVPWSHYVNTMVKEGDDLLSRARYLGWQAERILDSFPNEFAASLTKWSTFAFEMLRAGLVVAVVVVGVFFYVTSTDQWTGQEWAGVRQVIKNWLSRPIELGLVLLALWLFYRRLAFRFRDLDSRRSSGN